MKLVSGNSNRELSENIGKYLNSPIANCDVKKFADKEIFIEMNENCRGEDVFIIQSTSFPANDNLMELLILIDNSIRLSFAGKDVDCIIKTSFPANDNLMELLILIDTLKRASSKRITAVLPYYGYARQDRKPGPRTPITAKLVANLIVKSGADRVLTMDLHAGQIQGFFDIPTDNLFAAPVLTNDIKEKINNNNPMIVSPDVGGVVRARIIASRINSDLAIVDKRREKAGESEVMNIIGDVKDRCCFIIDDIVDSAGTLCNAAEALLEAGAKEVYAHVTHGVLSGKAVERVNSSALTKLVITDTIEETSDVKKSKKIETVSVVHLLGEAIKRISEERSVSSLFD